MARIFSEPAESAAVIRGACDNENMSGRDKINRNKCNNKNKVLLLSGG